MLFFKKIKNILITGPLACAIIVSCMAFFVFEGVYAESFFRKKLVWVKEKIIFTDTFDKTVTEKNAVQTVTEAKEEKPSPEELVIKPVDDPENMKLIFPKDENMYTTVTKDYFDDALFIGDSRTISLEIYGDWKNATYYTKQGISVWEILEEDVAKLDDGTTTTLEVALKQKEFKKIFIMLGVNELATGTSESFLEQYKKVVDTVRELQPEAVIFIQSIIHVSKEKSDAEEFIKNPTVLEFLGLPANKGYTETALEQAIIDQMQNFLLELGKGFSFVARQQHIRTETMDFYIDLVFYNYILKSFVIVELKTHAITHQDIGQLDMYVRMYDDLKKDETDNPTIGILLCTETDKTIARYSVLNDNKQLFASKYMDYLPSEKELEEEIERQKALLQTMKNKGNF